MKQEPTLQTISTSLENLTTLLVEYKKDTDKRFDTVDKRFEQIDQKFGQMEQRFEQVDQKFGLIDGRLNYIDQKFEGLTEIMLRNFDRLEKKIDDVRIELKEDIKAVFRTSILLSHN